VRGFSRATIGAALSQNELKKILEDGSKMLGTRNSEVSCFPADVRIAATTHRNLEEEVGKGLLRPELKESD
jgi:DNA-binding NtrC family response regulator